MKAFYAIFFVVLWITINNTPLNAQYQDYIGAGHDQGITVTASSYDGQSRPENTINGSGMDAELMEASRFLSMASFGGKMADIQSVVDMGFENWIDDQFAKSVQLHTPVMEAIWSTVYQWRLDAGYQPEDIFGPYSVHFNYSWWQTIITTEDQLRQRIAYALSQILVISTNSNLGDYAESLTSYYDVLLNNAFGNYRDLLLEVSLHPSMGYYLSHYDNPKADPANNIHPDENYAREIMQLFTIGLYELNNDGSRKLDSNGDPIPTYDNNDIKELAKVFTGLGAGAIEDYVDWVNYPYFGLGHWGGDKEVPMAMYEDWHEQGPKQLIGGVTIPANQGGMQDIEDAVDHLFNHPNVGPFIGRQLIQRLVKSNPTPDYINRVANVFNDNGDGVRGDMKAVIKAILLDPEARECDPSQSVSNGKLIEPVLRYAQVCRSLDLENNYNRYWNSAYNFMDATSQMVLSSPTVFNFYVPDFQPVGDIANANLVAPEYKIHNSRTSIGFINSVNAWVVWNSLMYSWEGDFTDDPGVRVNTDYFQNLIGNDREAFLNELDILFTHGSLSDETRSAMRSSMDGLTWGDVNYDRVRMGLYLLLSSPDFSILK